MPYDFVNKILHGHVLDVLKNFPDECIDMIMFSPPYYSLRTYGAEAETIWGGDSNCEHSWENCPIIVKHGHGGENSIARTVRGLLEKGSLGVFCKKCGAWKGQLGLEPSWQMYVEHMKQICHELKRVLKKEGSMYIVVGDTYMGSLQGYGSKGKSETGFQDITEGFYASSVGKPPISFNQYPYKRKSLMGIPWRIAFALIEDEWILRNTIIWHKPNALPTSARDRFMVTYEYIFFFVKSPKYYFNLDNVRVPHKTHPRKIGNVSNFKYVREGYKNPSLYLNRYSLLGKNPGDVIEVSTVRYKSWMSVPGSARTHKRVWSEEERENMSDFWNINTRGFKENHFAVYPIDVCVRPILASCPPNGIVLDPFCGSGTTMVVCEMINHGEWDKFKIYVPEHTKKLNWNLKWCGIEINPNYIEIAKKRLEPYISIKKITDFSITS